MNEPNSGIFYRQHIHCAPTPFPPLSFLFNLVFVMQFVDFENKDGARLSWNVLPTNLADEKRLAVPLGLLYTPLKPIVGLGTVSYKPISCANQNCRAYLNPFCGVNYQTKVWNCPFCNSRSHLPEHYSGITPEQRPPEIIPQYTTIEYITENVQKPPAFVFVIDTAMIAAELDALKSSILQSLSLIPQNALVGLITFGRDVFIHELSFEECPKSHVFRGNRAITSAKLIQSLGMKATGPLSLASAPPTAAQLRHPERKEEVKTPGFGSTAGAAATDAARSRFLLTVSECELQLNNILTELSRDTWPTPDSQRAQRATGAALTAAVALTETLCKNQNARILTFIGGPGTLPPGEVATISLAEPMRSHHDLQKGNAPLTQAASTFYSNLAAQAAANGHVIDVFAISLDQVGLMEMISLVNKTGGVVVLDDSFTHNCFTGSMKRLFATDPEDNNDLTMAFNAEVQVLTSKEIKITGAIGNASSLNRKAACVSDTVVGMGDTCAWRMGGIDPTATLAVYLEMANKAPGKDDANMPTPTPQQGYIQIVTKFRHSSGRTHVRVTTLAKTYANLSNAQGAQYIKMGFDQEAAAVLMTRLAVLRSETDFHTDVLRWLDRSLIKLTAKFATYTTNVPESFKLPSELTFYPQFMFNLRRSQFLHTFNSSPDETAFFRTVCNREHCTNTLVMIQPTLTSYSLEAPATPIMLDMNAINPKHILVLDTFFHVVIWYGKQINAWQAANVQSQPGYEHFAMLLRAPMQDANALMSSRFPTPRFIECVEGGSQARFLLAKLNPSTNQTADSEDSSEPTVFTEDVSLKVFLQHLRRLAVQPQ